MLCSVISENHQSKEPCHSLSGNYSIVLECWRFKGNKNLSTVPVHRWFDVFNFRIGQVDQLRLVSVKKILLC